MNQADRPIAEYWKRRAARTHNPADLKRAERLVSGQAVVGAASTKEEVLRRLASMRAPLSSLVDDEYGRMP